MGIHLSENPDEEVVNSDSPIEERESTDFPGTPFGRGDTVTHEELAPEKDSISGGVIQEPAWPAPNRDEDFSEDQRIVNRVHNLRTMATTNSAIAGHLKALGLAERTD